MKKNIAFIMINFLVGVFTISLVIYVIIDDGLLLKNNLRFYKIFSGLILLLFGILGVYEAIIDLQKWKPKKSDT